VRWRRETSKPRAAALCGGACAPAVRIERTACLPAAGARARNTTIRTDSAPGRRCLERALITLARQYGRYGYRRITALLQAAGWEVSRDRVQRIWRREGLKVPQKQKPRGRLWLNQGSGVRLRPERPNHVWSYDFVSALTHDGRTLRLLTLIDEFTRECLGIRVARRLGSQEVIETLAEVMVWRGIPEHLRSDNGPEFMAVELREWLGRLRCGNVVYRAGKSLGKRLLRKFQWKATG